MQRSPWLINASVSQARMRLFCFPYAGGSAFNFMPWRAVLDPSIEISAVQLPGRGARIADAPIASMSTLLKMLAPVITQHSELRFAFFGHSVGALIAFELARYLQLHGVRGPERLFVSGCQAPQYRSPTRNLHELPDAAFLDELKNYNGTPAEVLENRELMELILPSIRADFALAESYAYRSGPLLHAPLSVFAGKDDDNKASGQVDGWKRETVGDCRISWFDGGHFFVNTARDPVIVQINAELADIQASVEEAAT